MVITYEQGAGGQPCAAAGEEPVDKQQEDAWESLRANAISNPVTAEQGDRLLSNVEEITRQSLLACYGPHCFTISN